MQGTDREISWGREQTDQHSKTENQFSSDRLLHDTISGRRAWHPLDGTDHYSALNHLINCGFGEISCNNNCREDCSLLNP